MTSLAGKVAFGVDQLDRAPQRVMEQLIEQPELAQRLIIDVAVGVGEKRPVLALRQTFVGCIRRVH